MFLFLFQITWNYNTYITLTASKNNDISPLYPGHPTYHLQTLENLYMYHDTKYIPKFTLPKSIQPFLFMLLCCKYQFSCQSILFSCFLWLSFLTSSFHWPFKAPILFLHLPQIIKPLNWVLSITSRIGLIFKALLFLYYCK